MNKKVLGFLYVSLITATTYLQAADVQIVLEGSILGQSCNINSNQLTKTVTFNDIMLSDFAGVGSTTKSEKMIINLSGCTGNVQTLSYQFSGEADDINPELFKIKGSSDVGENGIASGLGIEVKDINSRIMIPNEKFPLSRPIRTSTYDLEFNISYKSTRENIMAGDASSILYLDIYYD